MGRPSSSRAATSRDMTSVPSCDGIAWRRMTSSRNNSRISLRMWTNRPQTAIPHNGLPQLNIRSASLISARRRTSRGPSSTPNTTRRMTSRVRSFRQRWMGNDLPTGQVSIDRSAMSHIISPYSRMRAPWNGGMSSFRSRLCRFPSSRRSEFGPSKDSNTLLAWPARNWWASPVKICLMAEGSVKNTIGGRRYRRTVNGSPYLFAQASMKGIGSKTHLLN